MDVVKGSDIAWKDLEPILDEAEVDLERPLTDEERDSIIDEYLSVLDEEPTVNMDLIPLTVNVKAHRAKLNGRDYLVADATLIVEGVLNGNRGPLFYPLEEMRRNPLAWNGMPIVLDHPKVNGAEVSARDPEVLEKVELGRLFKVNVNGKLTGQTWFDEELVKVRHPATYNRLLRGEPIELSTGLFTRHDMTPGTFNGTAYDAIARDYEPDHLAILPHGKGACSVGDGCGVHVNRATEAEAMSWFTNLMRWMGLRGMSVNALPVVDGFDTDAVVQVAAEFATEVMPGYGQVYVHPELDKVWYVGGDGDPDGFADKVLGRLSSLPGVTEAVYEAEMFPPEAEGWIKVYPEEDIDMPVKLSANARKGAIDFIVANCAPWKSGRPSLEKMEDAQLLTIKGGVKKPATNATPEEEIAEIEELLEWLKGAPPDIQKSIAKKIKAAMGAEMGVEPVVGEPVVAAAEETVSANQKPVVKTTAEWLQEAPPEVREVFQVANSGVVIAKRKLVDRLTVNLSADKKVASTKRLMTKSVQDLEELTSFLPPEQEGLADYRGAAVGADVTTNEDDEDNDVLPTPGFSTNGRKRA